MKQEEFEVDKFVLLPKSKTKFESKITIDHPPIHSKLFESWKILVDRYKAFMELKNKRFTQLSILNRKKACSEKLDFVKLVRIRYQIIVLISWK